MANDAAAVESFEVERKYETPVGAELPPAVVFAELGLSADAAEPHTLRATYFDTADGALARQRLAMRMREGGKDAGWHLKEKGPEGARELLWPPAPEMPDGLRRELMARIGSSMGAVAPIATLRTARTVVRLRAADGREVVELADDSVVAEDRVTGVRRAWHEWEAELMPGEEPALLDLVEPVLLAAGAAPSLSTAKIARATGRLIDLAKARGANENELEALRRMDASDREAANRIPPQESQNAEKG